MTSSLAEIQSRLAALVALPSVSAVDPAFDMSNAAVVDRLCEWHEAAGFRITRQAVSASPAKFNMVATLGPSDGPGLVLSGHTDTVPYDEGRWASDPFTLTERDGRWVGLGSADMKCFFPIVLAALEDVPAARLRRPLTVLATADEESTMAGAVLLEQSGLALGGQALIGEPTELVPVYAHKGILIGRIEVIGRSGHSSNPARGANALDCLHDIMTALKAWRLALAARYRDTDFEVPIPTLNLGRIQGGDSPNRICARAELLFDVRLMPGMSIDETIEQLRAIVGEACARDGVEGALHLPMRPVSPLATPRSAALVQTLEKLSGNAARTVAFATEGPMLARLGCETVIFGPGDIGTAHQPNEAVDIANVARMVDILRALIETVCCHE